ncbi:hypothetical protein Tco_1221571 [Tanacetum coccineum]
MNTIRIFIPELTTTTNGYLHTRGTFNLKHFSQPAFSHNLSSHKPAVSSFNLLQPTGTVQKGLGKECKRKTIVHPPVISYEHVAVQKGRISEEPCIQEDPEPVESSAGKAQTMIVINLKFLRALPSFVVHKLPGIKTRVGLESMSIDGPIYKLSDKSSDSETYASCDSSLKTKTKDFPPAVDIKTLPESDVEDPNSTTGSPSFSCLKNVKSPRIFCNKSGMNNRNVCKTNSVRVKKCFVCGSKLHLIKDCDFYNCVESVPCKSKAASVPAGSRNSPASVAADGSDPAASRNGPAVNSAGRPNPAGWSKRPAPVSAGRPVSCCGIITGC